MIPIATVPDTVNKIIDDMRLSHHQKTHLSSYVTGLIASRRKTVSGISINFLGGPSSKALNRFLTEYKWNPKDVNKQRLKEIQKYNETRWSRNGVGIIDDTFLEKTGKKMPYAGKFYDHSEQRYIHAQNVVTLHYADNKVNYPITEQVYEKKNDAEEFATKIQIAMQLVLETIELGLPIRMYVFDSWYLCNEFVEFLEKFQKFWISRCKSNLLVRGVSRTWISLEEYEKNVLPDKWREVVIRNRKLIMYEKTLFMKSLNRKVRIIISHETDENGETHSVFLATNKGGNAENVLADYMLRGKIDAFYKDAKQYLGFEDCQIRNKTSFHRHLVSVFLAHTVLKLGVVEGKFSKLASTVHKSAKHFILDLLEEFVYFVIEKGTKAIEVLNMILKY